MDRWKELVDEEVKERSNSLVKTFQDNLTFHRFSINHVDPFGYMMNPITIDYTLFVDIERTDTLSGKVDTFREVSLGSFFNSGPRRLVDFGEQYFGATYNPLIEIVGQQFKSEKRFEKESE